MASSAGSLTGAEADLRPPGSDFRSLGPWFLAVLLNSYGSTLFTAGCYDFADKQLGATATARLWMSALWGFMYIFIAFGAGRISERLGPRKSLFIMTPACVAASVLAMAMMLFPFGSPWAPWVLAGLMAPFNLTNSACWPALESAISRAPGRMRLSTRMSLYNVAWAAAGFAAFFTRGALESAWWGSIFLAPAIAMAGSFAALWQYTTRIAPASAGNPHEDGEAELDTPELRRRARTLLHMAWIGNAMAYVAINVMLPVLMKLANEAEVTDLTLVGFLTSAWGFTRVAGFLWAGKWTGWHYKARWLVGSQVALTGCFLLMMVVHATWVFVLAQIVFGLAAALVYSSSLYYAMHTSEGSGGHAGLHEALIGVGICIGPVVGALAGGSSVGVAALSRIGYSVTAVMAMGIIVMAWMGQKTRGRTAS